jgi:hypothetical protein
MIVYSYVSSTIMLDMPNLYHRISPVKILTTRLGTGTKLWKVQDV